MSVQCDRGLTQIVRFQIESDSVPRSILIYGRYKADSGVTVGQQHCLLPLYIRGMLIPGFWTSPQTLNGLSRFQGLRANNMRNMGHASQT
jgi:hypothetical protein